MNCEKEKKKKAMLQLARQTGQGPKLLTDLFGLASFSNAHDKYWTYF